ncbi:MAG: hypothetical protein ACK53Y_15940, partial [bacterium]
TWKAHAVMEQYLKHHFYEHPSISAVLARHLADNYMKPEITTSSQISTLENAVKSLTVCLDKITNKGDKGDKGDKDLNKKTKDPRGSKSE